MIHVFLLLCGSRLLRRKWWMLFSFGMCWALIGAFFFADALIDEIRIPPVFFALPLLFDGAWSLTTSIWMKGAARSLRVGRSLIFLGVAFLIIGAPAHSGMIIGILAGSFLMIDACWRSATSIVLRYDQWKIGLFYAVIKFASGAWSVVPWPTHWEGEVGADAGTLMIITGISVCGIALRIKSMDVNLPILSLFNRGWPHAPKDEAEAPAKKYVEGEEVIVHVWTPTDKIVAPNRGVSRYIAAVDKAGRMSTGHAALEIAPDVYISHYPAEDIDRSPSEFINTFRATEDNNVRGRFLPDYKTESSEWMRSTFQVRYTGLNADAVRRFWKLYRQNDAYNLTNRNCSTAVAKALDIGVEGLLETRGCSLRFLVSLFLSPEFFIAGFMRRRAAAMVWTPGFLLDYARALSYLVALYERKNAPRKI